MHRTYNTLIEIIQRLTCCELDESSDDEFFVSFYLIETWPLSYVTISEFQHMSSVDKNKFTYSLISFFFCTLVVGSSVKSWQLYYHSKGIQ